MDEKCCQNKFAGNYQVSYSGDILDGFTKNSVVSLLQQNAGMSIEVIKKLMPLRNAVIKKNISFESAQKMVSILRQCGLDCRYIKEEGSIVRSQNEQKTIQALSQMTDVELRDTILSLGRPRAKDIALSVIAETTKDSLGSLKENAEEKLASLFSKSQQKLPNTEMANQKEMPADWPKQMTNHIESSRISGGKKIEKAFDIYEKYGAIREFWGPRFSVAPSFSERIIAVRLRGNRKVQNLNEMWYKEVTQHLATQGDFGLESS